MVTLARLCAEMECSKRHLTPRAARDWWTKGLLPRPRRHGLGRTKGTETYWSDVRVIEQAKATHDLLASHSRTYTALIGLWLQGYPIELKLVRAAWKALISRNQPRRDAPAGRLSLDDAVGRLAARVGPAQLRPDTPGDVKRSAIDFWNELLSTFFGSSDEPASYGLAAALSATMPYWRNKASQPFSIDEEGIEWLMEHVRNWLSLPAQSDILRTASNHEFVRARRVLRIAFGIFCRFARSLPKDQCEALQEHGRIAVVTLGRPMLLPLLAILRKPPAPHSISLVLRLSREMKFALRDGRMVGAHNPA
jgi:hypothetical protein